MPKGTPTYLTQNSDGTISADFSGHVFAGGGIDIIAGSAQQNSITWHQTTKNGPMVAKISGDLVAGNSLLDLTARDISTGDNALIELAANGGAGSASTRLSASGVNSGQVYASAFGPSGPFNRTIIDGSSKSSFLQLAALNNFQMALAGVTVAVPAGVFNTLVPLVSPWSTNHYIFLCSLAPAGAVFNSAYSAGTQGNANGNIQGNSPIAQNVLVSYISIGN